MFISYKWLSEITPTRLNPEELRERLTMVGLAIDAVETHNSDSVLDVEVPSNRPDCLSHVGIAREVSVIEHLKLQIPGGKKPATEGQTEKFTSVKIEDEVLCPRYAARLVRGVKIGPSPAWLVERLEAIGQRPINNVADITNYVLHELGQPLHAFDFDKLAGRRIVVRRAAAGEKLRTLDGVDRSLTTDMLVIADAERPVALAGIMGGEDSEISNSTTDVLLESAYFNPDSIRRTARALGMDTEASRRFERGADCENVLRAQDRCLELICELAGGVATENALDVYPRPMLPRVVNLRPARVEQLTSLTVAPAEMKRILTGLGFVALSESTGEIDFTVPSWRVDVEQEEDLVEEVARHTGYDLIGSELPPSSAAGEYQPTEMKQRFLRRALNGAGFNEAINFSFVPEQDQVELLPLFAGQDVSQAELKNPIIEGASRMRLTLLPGLLNSLRHNLNHGSRDVRLFELGQVFAVQKKGELPWERLALGMVATGGVLEENRAQVERECDFFDLKGALESGVAGMNLSSLHFEEADVRHLRLGQAAAIKTSDNLKIGTIGRLAEEIASSYKFRQPVFVLELDLSTLLSTTEQEVQYTPLPRYPAVMRDLSLLVSRNISFAEIVKLIKERSKTDCRDVMLVGTYEGANIPLDKRSITLRLEYRSDDRTLRDEEVDEQHAQLTGELLQTFAAEQR
ncbi:MAG TPA: phenylalanine--tRNA ligase subunit beta [Pyrinomonadaceae bacterium]|nr:phenylalanine--tRNA ligase subunit beta [Pyrinomonadaceae bacterium]